MKKEKLYEILGEIDEKHIMDTQNTKNLRNKNGMRYIVLAACFCFAVISIVLYYNYTHPKNNNTMYADNNPTSEVTNTPTPEATNTPTPEITDTPVPKTLDDLIAEYESRSTTTVAMLLITLIGIDDMVASYEVLFTDSRLENFIGEPFEDSEISFTPFVDTEETLYYPKDADNLKYLIEMSQDGDYALLVFYNLETYNADTTYTYDTILKTIYNVDSAEDIVSITTTPYQINNTDAGKQAQEKVGTHTYTDKEDIATFYNIATNAVYLSYTEEKLHDQNRFTYSFSTEFNRESFDLFSIDITYGTRVLSIELTNGTTIEGWKYDALAGAFFEYGNIQTKPLAEEDVYALNEILGIQ